MSKNNPKNPLGKYLNDSGIHLPKGVSRSKERMKIFELVAVHFKYKVPGRLALTEKAARKTFSSCRRQGRLTRQMFHATATDEIVKANIKRNDRIIAKNARSNLPFESLVVIGGLPGKLFYQSPEWRHLRYATLEELGNECLACGASPESGSQIHVDHIKPRSLYPELALDPDNLQILCEDCNLGKMNHFDKDWRATS